jgi:DNA-directed RNA polymerase subunit RPC12/RpoP
MTDCPRCGSRTLYHSHTRLWEMPLKLITARRAYRCMDCRWRGWIVREEPPSPGPEPEPLRPQPVDVDLSKLE